MSTALLEIGDIHRLNEVIVLLEWFAEKFAKGVDEIRKNSLRMAMDFKTIFTTYLEVDGEYAAVASKIFERELLEMKEDWYEKVISKESK